MDAPKCRSYGGISPEELSKLRARLAEEGVPIADSDSGTISGPYGIVMTFDYNPPMHTLRLCIVRKPFYIPDDEIWKVLETAVRPFVG